MEIKMMLSIPRTISNTVKAKRLIHPSRVKSGAIISMIQR
jgi:hypothetical protein